MLLTHNLLYVTIIIGVEFALSVTRPQMNDNKWFIDRLNKIINETILLRRYLQSQTKDRKIRSDRKYLTNAEKSAAYRKRKKTKENGTEDC